MFFTSNIFECPNVFSDWNIEANGQNLHFFPTSLIYSFKRWSNSLWLGNGWKVDRRALQYLGCFALQVFEPITWLKTMNCDLVYPGEMSSWTRKNVGQDLILLTGNCLLIAVFTSEKRRDVIARGEHTRMHELNNNKNNESFIVETAIFRKKIRTDHFGFMVIFTFLSSWRFLGGFYNTTGVRLKEELCLFKQLSQRNLSENIHCFCSFSWLGWWCRNYIIYF